MVLFGVLLEDLGGFGLSQIILFLMLCYYHISAGMNDLATVFIAYTPNYRFDLEIQCFKIISCIILII